MRAGAAADWARSSRGRRAITSFAAGTAMYLVTAGGLFFHAAPVQSAMVTGAVVALCAGGWADAGATAAASVLLGMALMSRPATLAGVSGALPVMALAVGMSAIAAVVAGAARWSVSRSRTAAPVLFGLVFAMLVGNLWVTSFAVDSLPNVAEAGSAPLLRALDVPVRPDTAMSDGDFYRRVVELMRQGTPYYAAYRQAYHENTRWESDPLSPVAVRLPTMFVVWSLLPGGGAGLVASILVISTIGMAAGASIGASRARVPLVLVGAGALASYFLFAAVKTSLLSVEPFGAVLGLCAVAAYLRSFDSPHARRWCAVAVAIAVVACLTRELVLFVPVAGLLSAVVARDGHARFRRLAWLAGLAAIAVGYAAHYLAASGTTAGSSSMSPWLRGGPAFAWSGVLYSTKYLGDVWWMAAVLAAAGLAGALASRGPRRAFTVAAVLLPYAAFLLAGNGAINSTGEPINYWGTLVQPILYSLVPWALALLPGAARAQGSA